MHLPQRVRYTCARLNPTEARSVLSPIEQCKECVDLLGEYIEETLPPERAKALEEHLSSCPPCITFVRTYKATRKLCRRR